LPRICFTPGLDEARWGGLQKSDILNTPPTSCIVSFGVNWRTLPVIAKAIEVLHP
jgi:hypothetical protein